MKTLILIISLVGIQTLGIAQDYQPAMEKSIAMLQKANDPAALTDIANRFERIAKAEKEQWLPRYYTAYAYIRQANQSETTAQKDEYLNIAQQHLDQAMELQSEESELVTLQGYLQMIRVSIDPASRGQQLGPVATQTLTRALKLNPENPRALLMLGQMLYGTDKFFGNDTSMACAMIQQSVIKFEQEDVSDPLMPHWGAETAQRAGKYCGS